VKSSETEDKDRVFSERYYGWFERRIPVEEVEEDKVSATFKQGVLTVTTKHIAINWREHRRPQLL
jgi:HSP20 family protein